MSKWLWLMGFLSAATAAAQTANPAFLESVDVRVVNVEVMVTDSSGQRVPDLTAADFELLEDGRPQRIGNFYRIVDGAARLDDGQVAAADAPADERFRRRLLLVIDNNFLDVPSRSRALEHVRDFVADRFGGDAEWAVAAIGEELQYLMPFTREPFEVTAALDRIAELPTYADRHRLDRSMLSDPVRGQYMQGGEGGGRGLDLGANYRFTSREQAQRNLQSFALMADVLGGLMRSYASAGGRKAIVLVSGKMEFHPEMQYLVSQDPRTRNDTGLTDRTQSDPSIEGSRKQLEAVLAALVRGANTAGFQLYTLSAAGLTNPTRLHDVSNRQIGLIKNTGSFAAPPETSDLETAPRTLSAGTGGLTLRSNRLDEDLARVIDDTASYYSLGYTPDHAPDHRYHRITVRLKRPGLTVRHREGYLDLTASERLAEELATPLAFPKPKGALPVELDVRELGRDGAAVRLEATVSLPVRALTLLPAGADTIGADVEVLLAVYDERGDNLSVEQQRFPLRAPAAQEAEARAGTFRTRLQFALPPGAYTITVTVRDPAVSEHGTGVRQVMVGTRG